VGGGGNAAWEDALVVCIYRTYEMYGDTQVISDHWASLTRYMEHLAKVAPDGVRQVGAFGDWLLLDGPQKSAIHGTAYYFYSAKLMAEMAAALGKKDEADRYASLAAHIRDVFREKFVTADGRVEDNGKTSQTFYALALAWNLIPDDKRTLAVTHLTDLIQQRGGHLATGFIGTPVLLPALAGAGRSDVAYDLLLKDSFPSWLYQVKLGATTTWERWDGWTPDKGFQNPGMNSFNHYWLGCVGEWIFTGVTGMDTSGAGWKHIVFRPQFTDKLTKAHYAYDSIRGRIESGWVRQGNMTTFTVVVPTNTTAAVFLPPNATGITLDGKPVGAAASTYALEGGRYVFQFSLPAAKPAGTE
jgi:alpha-L-rhamnosidase